MKKYYVILAAFLLAAACTQNGLIVDDPAENEVPAAGLVTYIQAFGEQNTKASIDGSTGDFTWNTSDQIAVYAGGYKFSDDMDSAYEAIGDKTKNVSGTDYPINALYNNKVEIGDTIDLFAWVGGW